ncbi:caspase family protein [Nonomuraea wenchangensis]
MHQPNPATSRALLIGVSRYAHLDDLPAVDNNLVDLRKVLTDPELWGLPDQNVTTLDADDLAGPDAEEKVLRAIRRAAAEAGDGLLVYFAGHGLTDPTQDDPELFLALPQVDPGEVDVNTLPYNAMAKRLASRAQCRIVILDCCYSGLALRGAMSAAAATPRLMIEGTCVLTATPPTRQALALPGHRNSAFTGALLRRMNEGVQDGPELLDMSTLYQWVTYDLAQQAGRLPPGERPPKPDIVNRKLGNAIALVRNRTPRQGPGAPASPPLLPGSPGAEDPSETVGDPRAAIDGRVIPPTRTRYRRSVETRWSIAPLLRNVVQLAFAGAAVAGLIVAWPQITPLIDRIPDVLSLGQPAADDWRDAKTTGEPIRTAKGDGFTYELIRAIRTNSKWGHEVRPSITVIGYATRTTKSKYASMNYRFSNADNGAALEGVPFQGGGDGDPPVRQRSLLVSVVWDTQPRAKHITITMHDFFWPGDRDLVIRKVPVSSGS